MSATSTRGKKCRPHRQPDDPPRFRANKRRGRGTFDNDRPPVAATVGRQTDRACFHVVEHSDRVTLEAVVQATTTAGALLNTDEWRAYGRAPDLGRGHVTVNHDAEEWARDDDGHGVREVHINTMEGTWTGLRNFLRPFPRGEQVVPGRLRGDVRVVARDQAGQRRLSPANARQDPRHHLGIMSQKFLNLVARL